MPPGEVSSVCKGGPENVTGPPPSSRNTLARKEEDRSDVRRYEGNAVRSLQDWLAANHVLRNEQTAKTDSTVARLAEESGTPADACPLR